MNSRFLSTKYRHWRTAPYVGLGAVWLFFVGHGLYAYEFGVQRQRLALEWMALMIVLNGTGAAAYTYRFPERWFRYRFDLVGASHQIFHVMVLLAGFVHYYAVCQAFLAVRSGLEVCQ
ncbi:hypothetical protein LTR86_002873 [Recurvomyces mirabilis]|nr:hypothetical protein LTR86_002873 [Recurvomyces mirabilis]